MTVLLKARDLTLQRGDAVVADSLSLEVATGELWLLTGPNGAGKTSLLRALAGLLAPISGSIDRPAEFHWVSAQELPAGTQTPRDWLRTQAALQNHDFEPGANVFGIAGKLDTPTSRLSTGWRQRVKLSRLLLEGRPLWLLDEPSDGLDAHGLSAFMEFLDMHRTRGGAAVIATHQPDLWPANARRIAMGAA